MSGFFGLFDYSKPGKGISKEEVQKTGIALYFDIFFRRFWKMITLNLLFVVASIPAIIVVWFISSFGLFTLMNSSANLKDLMMDYSELIWILNVIITLIVVVVFGAGPSSAGMAYVLRNYVNDTHSWVWSDFKEHYKKNFLQAAAVFIIDVFVLCMLTTSFFFYNYARVGVLSFALRAIILSLFIVFTLMHIYIYPMMATFKLKIKDLYRNSAILAMAKLPWNVLAFTASCVFIYINGYAVMSSPLGIFLIGTISFSFFSFTQIFMTNNIMRELLLNPSLAAAEKKNPPKDGENPVLED